MLYISVIIPTFTLVFSLINGTLADLSTGMLEKCGEAVTVALSLCGVLCFWCGLMKVAEKAGIVRFISRLLSPLIGLLFRGVKKGSRAAQLISMNLAANVMGLGNATTPLGIQAMQELDDDSGTASDSMIMLTVLNTASLQIIPTTAAALRAAQGAEQPMDILPCVWIVSLYSVTAAVLAAKLLGKISRRKKCS